MPVRSEDEITATHHVLERSLGADQWFVTPPAEGQREGAYIARSGGRVVFVKWGVHGRALQRLSELEIVPPVLVAGSHAGREYIVQQYVDGKHPARAWFSDNLDSLARLIRTYQDDDVLTALLTADRNQAGTESIDLAVRKVNQSLSQAGAPAFNAEPMVESLRMWRDKATDITEVAPVPVHLDPNSRNFVVSSGHIYLVDWDEITLSDPMRDVGPMLWWYVPRPVWSRFFAAYGVDMTEDVLHRVYWWTAHRSISVALWLAERQRAASAIESFLADFRAAASAADNPR